MNHQNMKTWLEGQKAKSPSAQAIKQNQHTLHDKSFDPASSLGFRNQFLIQS
jgi:hypothetical protein